MTYFPLMYCGLWGFCRRLGKVLEEFPWALGSMGDLGRDVLWQGRPGQVCGDGPKGSHAGYHAAQFQYCPDPLWCPASQSPELRAALLCLVVEGGLLWGSSGFSAAP